MADTLSKVILGPACRIKGEMHLDGDLQLHGHCEGSIHVAGTLDVRAEGSVRGLARAGAIRVAGTVDADLVGEQGIALLEGCHVTGRVFATRLLAVKGATVQAQVNIGPGAMAQAPVVAGSPGNSTATADAKAAAVRSLDEIARQTHQVDEDDQDEHAAATQMNAMEISEVAASVADVEMMESVGARVPGSARASSAVPTSISHAVDAVDNDLSHALGEQAISVAAALDDADEQRAADDAPIAEAADAADVADATDDNSHAPDEAEVATLPTSIRAVLQRRPRMSNLTAHSRRSA